MKRNSSQFHFNNIYLILSSLEPPKVSQDFLKHSSIFPLNARGGGRGAYIDLRFKNTQEGCLLKVIQSDNVILASLTVEWCRPGLHGMQNPWLSLQGSPVSGSSFTSSNGNSSSCPTKPNQLQSGLLMWISLDSGVLVEFCSLRILKRHYCREDDTFKYVYLFAPLF